MPEFVLSLPSGMVEPILRYARKANEYIKTALMKFGLNTLKPLKPSACLPEKVLQNRRFFLTLVLPNRYFLRERPYPKRILVPGRTALGF
jgi:hypothetical protein